jgi:ABC-type multidrug transport system fused ATPase/permease subunit
MVFLSYNGMIIWPVRGLGRVLSEAGKTVVSLGRLREILETVPETDPPDAIDTPISGDIEFDNVSFAYDGAYVLKDVSFTVKEGTALGILGATGSGKTTVAHLLCRLYDLEEGEGTIRIGGVDIKKYKRRHLRKNVGIVLQEPFLYSGTIAENVAGLSKDHPLEGIREAAAIAQVDSDIERFAHGYDTIVGERGVTVGEFMVFLSYNGMIIWPVRGLGRVLSEAGKTMVSLGRLREILETPPETDPPDAIDSPISGDIEFDNVSFAYGGARVLKNVSFTVKEGTVLGILGATGSGKTTVAHLLCRLYDLKEGEGAIRIGGVDIKKYKRRHLRKNVGIVLQEPFLYSGTIAENVAGLSKDHPLEGIREAAAVAQIDSDIERFAHGYDTIVGERGVTLSGGQKQRVAIASAVLKDTPIMIFDDSLSAVDTETDARIRAALRARVLGVTAIIISHRVTTISGADLIMVMEDGRVAEIGTPSELMELGGIYRRVTEMQGAVLDEIAEDAS